MKARLTVLAPADRPALAATAWRFLSIALALLLAIALHPARAAQDEFLEPDKAFQFSARPHDAKSVEVTFAIAPGYYLYRDQFKFAAAGAALGAAAIPPGKVKFDETFQKNVETYRNAITILVPVEQAGAEFRLVVTSQGCADAGLCYPPMQSAAAIGLTGFGGAGTARVEPPGSSLGGGPSLATGPGAATAAAAETTGIDAVLRGGSFWPIVGAFFIAGLLLSLTPCVLPMLPIVSSIIVGQADGGGGSALAGAGGGPIHASAGQSRRRGFALAASYSFGMAVVYTAFGVFAGLAGEGLAAALQNPWVLGAFALGLVGLSLSMFGVYNLQLPSAITCRINDAARRLPGGRAAGVFAMGGVSALIVSPCVAAPLAGALLYLSQTRDVWLGGTALFSLAAGMSVPLLLVGASAGALLPRAGAWMVEVKAAFGVLLLGVALWTVQPILPGPLVLAL
ncbi:MAG TPA: protein-disulfide reductase DsbD domain-containing protein, partial [Caldimonas sp.]|nr:protein-disulfide reductase DsbD domain-containing protein [Caldimonas sp.]